MPVSRTRFQADLIEWLNGRLAPKGVVVHEHTELFADGLIDSVRILELIAWTERALGRRIPDHMIRMDLFGSVHRIAATFVEAPA